MTSWLIFLCLTALLAVNIQLKKLNMTIQEYKDQVGALGTQLVKILDEITHMIEVGQTVSQEDVDRLNAAKAAAQTLDDLNPDEPTP